MRANVAQQKKRDVILPAPWVAVWIEIHAHHIGELATLSGTSFSLYK